jgi:type II secretory pathway pseudopilin PulG
MMIKKKGFTLVEILLAMGVFLVGVVSILAVFPQAAQQTTESNDSNICAAFAESIRETLSKGMKAYQGDPTALVNAKDLVWFSCPLPDASQDAFFLPKSDYDSGKDMTWYPHILTNQATPSSDYLAEFGLWPASGEYVGFTATGARVRQMGRASLGTSTVIEKLESTEEDLASRLKDFYWCFSVKHEGSTPNLYHFTLYVFGNGVKPGGSDSKSSSFQLLDSSKPQAKGNQFLYKFDFLLGTT